jgi:hypothetical protein
MAQIAPTTGIHSYAAAPVVPARKEHSRALAGVLLTGALAAMLVVADQLIDIWTDGHLLAGWVALWTVTFALLAVMAPPLRQWSSSMAALFARWADEARARRTEAKLMEYAHHDPRILAELQAALSRATPEL